MSAVPDGTGVIKARAKGCGIGCGGLFALAIVIGLVTSGESKVERLKDADRQIRSVEFSGPNAWVMIDLRDAPYAKDYPFAAGMVLKAVGKAVKSGAKDVGPDTQFVQYVVTAPSTGRLGEQEHQRLFTGRLRVAELRAANYDKMSEAQMLNISDEITVPSRVAGEAIRAFCEDGDYGSWAAEFCGKAQ
ncbi:hypothetical protein [Sphingomonas sp. NPDC079357]|uniref:hypothetical protein n=1 Tax=Sphingomonas sp. NPDC079357 TaxID=3364518 RepID=UPI00384D0B71